MNKQTIEITKSEIVLTRDVWGDDLFNVVGKVLEILLKQEHICTVRDDDNGIIIIRHEHDESKEFWGCDNPYWITADEWEKVEFHRCTEEDEYYEEENDEQ